MTALHPATGYYQLSQYHLADLRHQAQRLALARAARRARRALAVLGPRNYSPAPAHERHGRAGHQARLCGHIGSPGR